MKSVVAKLRILHRNPVSIRESTTSTNHCAALSLTNEEVKQINAVVPLLCSSNHLKEAIQLISAALSTENPPLTSLPLSTVVNRIALEPDLTHPMYLLNSLKYNPRTAKPSVLSPIAKMLASSFFQKGHSKRAVKIFRWLSLAGFPGGAAEYSEFYAFLIDRFSKNGMILESLGVLKVMARENLAIGDEIATSVYRGLLREARVREAVDIKAALDCGTLGNDGCTEKVIDVLDRTIANWIE